MLLAAVAVQAAPVWNMPVKRIQPNGDTLRCLVSGDEYFHRLHDAQDFTIILNPENGWYVYARVQDGQLVPTQYVPGEVNPFEVGLRPHAIPSAEELYKRRLAWEVPLQYQDPTPKTGGRNHGTLNNIVIFIRFSDETQCCTETMSQMNAKFNDSSANAVSLYSYLKYTSYNKLRVVTHFFPSSSNQTVQSYQDSHPRGYYQPYSATNTDGYSTDSEHTSREFTLLQNAVNWVNNNSPVPSSLDLDMDNDGKIDNVCFVVSGSTDDWNDLLWPHKWSLYDRTVNINGKRVYTFNFQLAGSGDHYFGVSTLCHEMTHTIGAPDLYHYDNYTSVSAAGSWDLMHSNSTPPQQTNTLFKMKYLNWIDSIPTIADSGSYTMYSLGSGPNHAYKIASPNPHQWYVLEYRNDDDRFDSSIPNRGLLVWRYNDLSTAENASFDNGSTPHELWLFRPGSNNDITSGTISSASFGVSGRTAFGPTSNPHPYFCNGQIDSSFSITNIAISSDHQYVTFTFAPRSGSLSCDSITRYPHQQDFEMDDLGCWTFHSNNTANDMGQTNGAGITTTNPNSGGFAFRFSSYSRASDYGQYLISPRLSHDDTLQLSFYYRKHNNNTESLCVKYSTTTNAPSAFTQTLWTANLTTSYQLAQINVPPDAKYVAFYYQASYKYYVYVDDITIVSPCGKVRNYSYTQDFESADLNCWSFHSNNSANDLDAAANSAQLCTDNVHAGLYCFRFSSYYSSTDYNQYLISPELVHSDLLQLSFYYRKHNTSVENLYVKYSTTTDDPSAFTQTLWTATNISTTYQQAQIQIPANAKYVALNYEANYKYYVYVDDIRLETLSTPATYTLTVASADSTMGTASGGGTYTSGASATLTATANTGYHFVQWNDGNTANPRSVTVSGNATYTATFAPNQYTLTVSANNATMGTVSGGGSYAYNTTATLSATANTGYHFVQWNDGSTANPRTVTVTANATYSATFAPNQYTLTVSANDATMGTVSGGGSYAYNTTATFSATANTGYHFVQWSDGITANPRTVTVTANATYTATFAPNQYVIVASSNDTAMGIVSGGGSYAFNTTATLTATANTGYHFVQWTDGDTNSFRTVTITDNATYMATFAPNQYVITASANDTAMGIVSGGGSYAYNSTATLTATANMGYHFVQWTDGDTINPRTVMVLGNASYTATFEANPPNVYTVSAQSGNTDFGNVQGGGTYVSGTIVTLMATPAEGYHFVQWNDGDTNALRTVTVVSDTAFTATFAVNIYTLAAFSNDTSMGMVTGSGNYSYSTTTTLTAISAVGYHFVQWSDGDTNATRTITLTADTSFTAIFAVNTYIIAASSNDSAMGMVTGYGTYAYNTAAILTATPAIGYHFVQWNDGDTNATRMIIITSDTTFSATFAKNIYSLVATTSDTAMGMVMGSGPYSYNTAATLSAVPATGYHFVQWNDGDTNATRTITISSDTAFTAIFAVNIYTLAVTANDSTMGSATGSGNYAYNTAVTLTAIPAIGHHFVQWSDGDTNALRTISVASDTTFSAIFAINLYTLSAVSNDTAMGTITGSGTYAYNATATLTAIPTTGYHFVQWSDGDTNATRIITITSDTTFTAVFAVNIYILSAFSNDSVMGTVTGGGNFAYSTTATLTAIPALGYHFVQWNDGDTNATRMITITSDTTFTATFSVNIYTISAVANDSAMGAVTGSGTYAYNTSADLTAIPSVGHHFVQWNDGDTNAARTIVVTEDAIYVAIFDVNTYTILVATNDSSMGTVTGSGTYAYNDIATITATPEIGHHFVQWSDGDTNATRTIIVTEDAAYTAIFEQDPPATYTVTVQSNNPEWGCVTGSGIYNEGSQVTIEAVPNEGYYFDHWSNGQTVNPYTLTVTQDSVLTAIFAPKVAIQEAEAVAVRLYPNPAVGATTISLSGISGIVNISIVDMNGRTIRTETLECQGGCTKSLTFGNLAQGAYFVRITSPGFSTVKKLIVR